MTCNLHIDKLLKRQSKKCDSAQFVVNDENRPVYVLLPFHPQGPLRVPWKRKKKINISNGCKSKSDYSFIEKFGRTTTYAMLIK